MEEKIKILDVRPLPPWERHEKIFEVWNGLEEGEVLRLINDHDPKPLYYQFAAEREGEFEWKYEKQGPAEWIVTIKKIKGKVLDKRQEIKELLKQLKTKEDLERMKGRAKELLKGISPTELGLIEQELIQEGIVTREDVMQRICDIHLEVMKEMMGDTTAKPELGHPIHTFMEEHREILKAVDELKKILDKLGSANDFGEVSGGLEVMRHALDHLIEADKHHKREEDVLFPTLQRYGIVEPPTVMLMEHQTFVPKKKELHELLECPEKLPYSEFAEKARELGEVIVNMIPSHIYKEDNILYPMALQVIPKDEWRTIKKKCDEIGYCCFTPVGEVEM